MNLTANFTLEELCITDTGLPNEPGKAEKEKLLYLAAYLLQPIRDSWGALRITSGFRSMPVNMRINSTSSSQHVQGEAADFILVPTISPRRDLDDVFNWLVKESGLKFGQCIRESKGGKDWIHISLSRLNRPNQEALVYDGKEYKPFA